MDVDLVLRELIERKGSDLHLRTGRPPLMRLNGDLLPTEHPPLDATTMGAALQRLLGDPGWDKLKKGFDQDAAYAIPGLARFRVNALRYLNDLGAVVRAIPLEIPTIESLALPPVLKDVVAAPQGLILVTGPTGSGKSTTLAAMIDHLNQTEPLHILTIEDPVEFVYEDKMCTVTQRQLGQHTPDLHEALKRALRQDPDVILMGEMRDRETIEFGMHAAETGHLVFSTLHTNDAKQTIDRVLDSFPPDALKQVRSVLALTLRAVISQRLIRRADGAGRVGAVEILINSPQVKEIILEGRIGDLEKAMKAGGYYRMQSFNQALGTLVKEGKIAEEDAVGCSTNPGDLKLILRGVSGSAAVAGCPDPEPPPPAPDQSSAQSGKAPDSAKLKISRGFKL